MIFCSSLDRTTLEMHDAWFLRPCTFYWRPGCPVLHVTLRRGLRRRGIPFEAVNIWEDPDAAARVRAAAQGNETVPTIVIGEHSLVNPTAAQVESLLRQVTPWPGGHP